MINVLLFPARQVPHLNVFSWLVFSALYRVFHMLHIFALIWVCVGCAEEGGNVRSAYAMADMPDGASVPYLPMARR